MYENIQQPITKSIDVVKDKFDPTGRVYKFECCLVPSDETKYVFDFDKTRNISRRELLVTLHINESVNKKGYAQSFRRVYKNLINALDDTLFPLRSLIRAWTTEGKSYGSTSFIISRYVQLL